MRNDHYLKRFDELLDRSHKIPIRDSLSVRFADREAFHSWASSALNLLEVVFGSSSTLFERFRAVVDTGSINENRLKQAKGLFASAREEFSLGFLESVKREISGELTIDLCHLAESILEEGHTEPAAVIAAAALEDCIKRCAEDEGLETTGNSLTENINALKSKGVFSGPAAKVVSQFPRIRNAAMHAEWDKLSTTDIGTVVGFLKQFVLQRA